MKVRSNSYALADTVAARVLDDDARAVRLTVEEREACAFTPSQARLKRLVDVVASIVALALLWPFCLIIWCLVRLEDGGPALFRQERIGLGGRPFTLIKFRSMKLTSEADGRPALCQKNDSRLTRVGRFLREHHLDELPQLWNVLRGDMSFVGPRPERKYFVDKIMAVNPDYELLYQLRPGLFSMATLYNGYTDTLAKMLERLRMDLEYLRTHSLWLDVRIIWLTAVSIMMGRKF